MRCDAWIDGPTVTTTGEDTMLYELRNVSKIYERSRQTIAALQEVDLTIGEGELVAVQGSTGSGKTTLLEMLGALDRPTSGSVWFDGKDLARMREGGLCGLRSHAFGFIFQSFNLIPTLTAQENVETALVPLHVNAGERAERARSALADLGLADRAAHLPAELSGGEQQRVAIARALVRSPRVILADEPTGNVDEKTRDEIVSLLEGLWRERRQTIIIVTHDSHVASRASRLLLLDEGRIVSSERVEDVRLIDEAVRPTA
jgi:putative ABC transport system ATP-binding protein